MLTITKKSGFQEYFGIPNLDIYKCPFSKPVDFWKLKKRCFSKKDVLEHNALIFMFSSKKMLLNLFFEKFQISDKV
jgi:hypothetical protein